MVEIAKLGHLNPRRTTRAAAATMFLAIFTMLIVVHNATTNDRLGRPGLIWTVIAAGTVFGGAMSFYWPYLMVDIWQVTLASITHIGSP